MEKAYELYEPNESIESEIVTEAPSPTIEKSENSIENP